MGPDVMAAGAPQTAGSGVTTGGSVVVAMATYQRPEELARTLRTVLGQIDDAALPVRVQVVDNDPAGSAAGTIAALADERVSYVLEPTPGIAAARNRALDKAAADDVLIFIDDDEDPQPAWLVNLLAVYRTTGAAAVVGPVVSEYDGPLDEWIHAGGFFERRRLTTGTSVEAAATNNLLLDLNRVRSLGLRFDQQFGLSGGSDTLFTRQLTGAGERIIWCDQAVVVDHVPTARMTRGWVLRRARRYGNSWSRTSLALTSRGPARLLVRLAMIARGVIRVAAGAARFLLGAVTFSPRHRARGLRTLMKGAGYIMGATGGVLVEYSRPAVAAA
jgi:succinoglycan biosynthesis protein ExoM